MGRSRARISGFGEGGDQLARREDRMREGRTIDLVGRMHRLSAEGRRRILHEGDVVAEFHAETASRFDAGIRQHANDDNLFDPMLFQPGWGLRRATKE